MMNWRLWSFMAVVIAIVVLGGLVLLPMLLGAGR